MIVESRAPAWQARVLPEVACLSVLLAFALAVAAPVLRGGVPVATDTLALWAPDAVLASRPVHNAALADSALQNLPWQVFIRRSLAQGEWPLWDPGQFAGYPFLGNEQNQLYYPLAWLLLLLPLAAAIQVNVVLHIWLAAVGMYVLSRVLGASRSGSLLAGLAFAASGQFYTALEMTTIADIYVWLPWVLAAAELAWRRRSWPWAATAGLLFGVLTVAGHLPWFLYSSVFLALWLGLRVLALAVSTFRQGGRAAFGARSGFWGQVARAAAILAWGPALGAVHLVPFVEMARLSTRLGASLPPGPEGLDAGIYLLGRQFARALVPQFWGTPVGSIGDPLEFNNCWYVGLAPLALALVALLLRRERRVWALGTIALVALAVAAGLPGFNLVHRLPGLASQPPQRTAYLFIFGAAALSGLGLDALLALARRRPGIALTLGGLLVALALPLAALLAGWHAESGNDPALQGLQTAALGQAALIAGAFVVWWLAVLLLRGDRRVRGRAVLAGLLLGSVVVDLLTYAPGYNTYVRPEALEFHTSAANLLRADPGPWRMMAPNPDGPMFVPNSATLYGLADVQGYDSLHLARYEDYWAAADPGIRDLGYFGTILRPQGYQGAQADLLNVKYLTTVAPLNQIGQVQLGRTISELTGRPVTQTLAAPEGLTNVRIAFDTFDRVNHAPVTLHVRRSLTDTLDLARRTVDPSHWQGQPWVDFHFPPLAVHANDPLVLVLESPAGHGGDSVAVRVSASDTYAGGTLYRDGHPRQMDLGFVAQGTTPAKLQVIYDRGVLVYRNRAALPRAFTVAGAAVLPAADIPARLAQPGFDPRQVVLLEQPPPPGGAGAPDTQGAGAVSAPPGTATITRYRNLSVDVQTQMDQPGWLVLGDVNYPGWQVTVDGQAAPLYTAYSLVRAVPLPAGAHQVHFYFLPGSVLLGGAISAGALLAALVILLVGRRQPLAVRYRPSSVVRRPSSAGERVRL